MIQERQIEWGVVSYENALAQKLQERRDDLPEAGSMSNHGVRDPGHGLYERRNGTTRVDESIEAVDHPSAGNAEAANLGYPVALRLEASGLQVNDGVGEIVQGNGLAANSADGVATHSCPTLTIVGIQEDRFSSSAKRLSIDALTFTMMDRQIPTKESCLG